MTTVVKQENVIAGTTLHIKLQKDNFLKAITTTLGALGSKTTLPILNNILIQTDNPDEIVITGTDLEFGVRTHCAANVLLKGSVTAPAKKLYEIVREIPSGEIEVTVGKNNAVNIKTAKSFFKIMGLEAEDFPKLPELTSRESFEVEGQVLKRCLELTSFAVSRDETRYTLNGLLIVLKNKMLHFVATDGKRLAVVEKKVDVGHDVFLEAIIPVKAVLELLKALSDGEEKVTVMCGQSQIIFHVGKTTFVSRLIEGRFPNYDQVIPKEEKTVGKCDRQELLSAMKRVSILTSQENQAVKLDFLEGRLLISSHAPNLGEAKEEVSAEISGEDLTIGFNPSYVIDVLKNLETEQISFSVTDPDKPGLIKGEEGYLYVVMPMQLS